MSKVLWEQRLAVAQEVLRELPSSVETSAFEYAFLPQFGSHRIFYFPYVFSREHERMGGFMAPERMAAAMQCLIQSYPILAGQLVCESGRVPFLTDFDHGVCFVAQRVDAFSLATVMPKPGDRSARHTGFPPGVQLIATIAPDVTSRFPLVRLHHTRFACGGVAIGVHMSHYVGDGRTLADIMKAWVELFRAGSGMHAYRLSRQPIFPLLLPPYERDDLHRSQEEPLLTPKAFRTVAHSYLNTVEATTASSVGTIITGFLRFSRDDLLHLRQQCAMGHEISTTALLTAHLAICIARARARVLVGQQMEAHTVQIDLVMDLRRRMFGSNAAFSSTNYVGNFNLPSCVRVPKAQLAPEHFSKLARTLHENLRANERSNTYWKDTVAWLDRCRSAHVPVQHSSVASIGSFGENLCISSFASLQFYSLAFHADAPLGWQSNSDPSTGIDGLVGLSEMPAEAAGSIEAAFGVREDVWGYLLRLPELFPSSTPLSRL